MSIISIITDFGNRDGYVGIMKGVMLGISSQVQLVDLTHEIEPGDIQAAAWVLQNSFRYFPDGTVHLAVVDPGVGSPRRPIVLSAGQHRFVGPDNGIFTQIIESASADLQAFEINQQKYWLPSVSRTFHGRDIFAPTAVYLAERLATPQQVGTPIAIESLRTFRLPAMAKVGNQLVGAVAYVDRFGNLITNIPASEMRQAVCARLSGAEIPLGQTYASAEPGKAVAMPGSHGFVEIGVFGGSASRMFEADVNARVTIDLC